MTLIDSLIQQGWLKTPRIIEAFSQIKRKDFLPEDIKDLAEANEALPIGQGQTISQPLVVAFMIELLQPQPGEKILDVGSGSGWTSAILAHIVSQERNSEPQNTFSTKTSVNFHTLEYESREGAKRSEKKSEVIAIEVVPELKEFGQKNVAKYNFIEKGIVEFILADGSKGYEKEAPFDKILCSAAAQREIPKAWKKQLKIGGRLVSPINNSIWLLIKKSEADFEKQEHPGFVFVPLITEN